MTENTNPFRRNGKIEKYVYQTSAHVPIYSRKLSGYERETIVEEKITATIIQASAMFASAASVIVSIGTATAANVVVVALIAIISLAVADAAPERMERRIKSKVMGPGVLERNKNHVTLYTHELLTRLFFTSDGTPHFGYQRIHRGQSNKDAIYLDIAGLHDETAYSDQPEIKSAIERYKTEHQPADAWLDNIVRNIRTVERMTADERINALQKHLHDNTPDHRDTPFYITSERKRQKLTTELESLKRERKRLESENKTIVQKTTNKRRF